MSHRTAFVVTAFLLAISNAACATMAVQQYLLRERAEAIARENATLKRINANHVLHGGSK
mgnify:CR=1 FL=1